MNTHEIKGFIRTVSLESMFEEARAGFVADGWTEQDARDQAGRYLVAVAVEVARNGGTLTPLNVRSELTAH